MKITLLNLLMGVALIGITGCEKINLEGRCKDLPSSSSPLGYDFQFEETLISNPEFNPNNEDEMAVVYRHTDSGEQELRKYTLSTHEFLTLATEVGSSLISWDMERGLLFRRNDGHLWKVKSDGTGLTQVTFMEGQNFGGEWSSDGGMFSFANSNGAEYLFLVADFDGLVIDSLPITAERGFWAPDGKSLLMALGGISDGSYGIYQYLLESKELIPISIFKEAEGPDDTVRDIQWLSDSQRFVFVTGHGVYVSDIVGEKCNRIAKSCDTQDFFSVGLSPEGDRLIAGGIEQTLMEENTVFIRSLLYSMNLKGGNVLEVEL